MFIKNIRYQIEIKFHGQGQLCPPKGVLLGYFRQKVERMKGVIAEMKEILEEQLKKIPLKNYCYTEDLLFTAPGHTYF